MQWFVQTTGSTLAHASHGELWAVAAEERTMHLVGRNQADSEPEAKHNVEQHQSSYRSGKQQFLTATLAAHSGDHAMMVAIACITHCEACWISAGTPGVYGWETTSIYPYYQCRGRHVR
jgi:hypothetical protein